MPAAVDTQDREENSGVGAAADHGKLVQALANLVELNRRARQARTEAELGFLLVNDSQTLSAYRQAALWHSGSGVQTLSGLIQPETNAPYVQWVNRLCIHLSQHSTAFAATGISAAALPADLAEEWADWWPEYALWLPLPPTEADLSAPAGRPGAPSSAAQPAIGRPAAALLLARDHPWQDQELALLSEWVATWWHALIALRRTRPARGFALWRDAGGSGTRTRHPWRNPWLIAMLLAGAALAIPVPLTVLAPGELVPAHPIVIRAPLDGVIDTFHVQPNQLIKKGQPLFGFDEALIQSRLDVANQVMATAGTEYRQTTVQALSDPRSRPQLAALTGKIQEKRAEVTFLREQLTRARVLAPADGVALFDDPAEWIGKPVSVGERILRIAEPTDVEIEAWLPMADAIPLPAGSSVKLYLNASPLEPVPAKLRYLSHDAVQRPDGSFAYRVRASLDNPTAHRVGLKGTAKLQGEPVSAAYWMLRRPLATLRATLGI